MTTSEQYKEIELKLHLWECACYWCGLIFKKPRKGVEHINIEHDPKTFCSKACKLQWIDCKQVFGELMP